MKHFTIAAACLLAAGPSYASIIATLTESGSDVVLEYSGSIDTTGLSLGFQSNLPLQFGGIGPALGYFQVRDGAIQRYSVEISGPASYGSGPLTFFAPALAQTGTVSGDSFQFLPQSDIVNLPTSYVSGSQISGMGTIFGSTLASLGATPGTYVWSLDTASADTVTLTVGGDMAPIPLPAAGMLLLAGLAGLGVARRRT